MAAIILILTAARLFWTLKQKPQRPVNPGIDGVIAKVAHRMMYLSMLVMPFQGAIYLMVKATRSKSLAMN